jgi:hypothetical protein
MTEATMMFLNCPACLDQEGALRCGLPAEVRYRFTMRSTDGPLESVMIRCPVGHHFSGDGGGSALRDYPAAPERKDRRQNNTPAYYLGRPATVWITAMRPRRRRTGPRHLMEAAARSGNPTRDSGTLRHS